MNSVWKTENKGGVFFLFVLFLYVCFFVVSLFRAGVLERVTFLLQVEFLNAFCASYVLTSRYSTENPFDLALWCTVSLVLDCVWSWITDVCQSSCVFIYFLFFLRNVLFIYLLCRSWRRSCQTHPVEEWAVSPVDCNFIYLFICFFWKILEYVSLAVLP